MKASISKISLIVYVFLFIFSGFLLCGAGGRVPIFCIMGFFAIPPIAAGPKRYRILGIIALLIAAAAAAFDCRAGSIRKARINEILKQHQKQAGTLYTDGVEGIVFSLSKADLVAELGLEGENVEPWTPCESDVTEAISAIKIFLEKQAPSIASRFTEYRCQYFGYVVNGKRRIFCNFFPRQGHGYWKETLVLVMDGGDSYFHLEYEFESERCLNLWINGEA